MDGVVVKLAKCGGIGPALRMIRRARQLGMKVMLGCMVESSLGVAAAAMVASEVDWLDLDGNLLLAARSLRRARARRRLPLAALDGARPGRLPQRPPDAHDTVRMGLDGPAGWHRLGLTAPLWTTWWTSSWTTR